MYNDTPYAPQPKPKKGSLWAPIIFLAVMLTIGIAVFIAYPETDAPETLADTPWFGVEDGVVSFNPLLYFGAEELEVPEGITELSGGCFMDCNDLTTVHLPDSLVTVGDRAFSGCSSLRGLKLPEGVTQIGQSAFECCTGLEALTIPLTVTHIGTNAFQGCSSLRHIFFGGTKIQWIALNTGKISDQTTIYCVDGRISPADIGS